MRPPKYKNKKVVLDGITFDSIAESKRWAVLVLLEKAGRIKFLRRQVPYVLAPAVKIEGEKRSRQPMIYKADFVYFDADGWEVIEDVKGFVTKEFRIKQHLMKTVHGIDVRIVK